MQRTWNFTLLVFFTVRAILSHRVQVHASSCTYYFLVSAVPFVLLAGMGAAWFASNDLNIIENIELYIRVKELVDTLDIPQDGFFRKIGIAGIVIMVWYASSLIREIGIAFGAIFPGEKRRNFLNAVISYVMVPIVLIAAIMFSTLGSAIVALLRWILADTLQLVNQKTFVLFVTPLVSGIFVTLAVFACFMLLAPRRPQAIHALKGSIIFAAYFIMLQYALRFAMVFMIESYAKFGALGGILLLLLWALTVFYGLFSVAEYVGISGRFSLVKRMSYIETYFKPKMTLPERFLLRKMPFANGEYLTYIGSGCEVEYENISCCVVVDGEVVLTSNGVTWRLKSGDKFVRAGILHLIFVEAVTDSKILLLCEKDFKNLPEYSPKIWGVLHEAIKWTERAGGNC